MLGKVLKFNGNHVGCSCSSCEVMGACVECKDCVKAFHLLCFWKHNQNCKVIKLEHEYRWL